MLCYGEVDTNTYSMKYSVQQLANLANVTVRTLHHYDKIGLLSPARTESNGYRVYEEAELLRLQQIMFFRELEFPLVEIKAIIESNAFDIQEALTNHRKIIAIKRKRMSDLIATIDKTLQKINTGKIMSDKELYDGFGKEEWEKYTEEAKKLWGARNVEVSIKKYKALSPEEKQKIQEDGEELLRTIVANMNKGTHSPEIQKLIAKHYKSLGVFYEPNLELYRGLADLYVDDKRFTAYFDKFHKSLAAFMHDAMIVYCEAKT